MSFFKKRSQENVRLKRLYNRLSKLSDSELERLEESLGMILDYHPENDTESQKSQLSATNEQTLDELILVITNKLKSDKLSQRLEQFKQLKSGKSS